MTGGNEVLLAIDFGLRRLGIATGNLLTRTATPLETLTRQHDIPWAELDRLVADWGPVHLIIGLPPDPDKSGIRADVDAFVAAVRQRYDLPVETVDETLTSRAAQSAVRDGRRSGFLRRRVDKGRLDRLAACLIAEQWMNSRPDER